MKRILFLIFITTSLIINGQTWCNPSITFTNSFPANSTLTNTFLPHGSPYVLCGPNTIVYDTLILNACSQAYVNTTCTLVIKPLCSTNGHIWLKGNATLVILPGSQGPNRVNHEPTAIINNLSGFTFEDSVCSSISFPDGVCYTEIKENLKQEEILQTWPNPSSDILHLNFYNQNFQYADVSLTNQLGELIFERKQWSLSDKSIKLDAFSNGSYFLNVRTPIGRQTKKVIILK